MHQLDLGYFGDESAQEGTAEENGRGGERDRDGRRQTPQDHGGGEM